MTENYLQVVEKRPIVTTAGGGKRQLLEEAWHLIPAAALSWFAKVFYYGAGKYAPDNWKSLDFNDLSASPINHAAKHLFKAKELPEGSEERKWQLAKAGVNICMQLWYEDRISQPDGGSGGRPPSTAAEDDNQLDKIYNGLIPDKGNDKYLPFNKREVSC